MTVAIRAKGGAAEFAQGGDPEMTAEAPIGIEWERGPMRVTILPTSRALLIAFLLVSGLGSGAWAQERATATFAGGCFWCMQPPFDRLDGVLSTTVGYTGGHTKNPSYEQVSAGGTGHAESIQIIYDPTKVSYTKLLEVFWRNVDPLTPNAQFCDHGTQYRSVIFFHNPEQQRLAEDSKKALDASGRFKQPIVTEIVPASTFYPAEDYHQAYYRKNPLRYKYYRYSCGRDRRLQELWGAEAGGPSAAH